MIKWLSDKLFGYNRLSLYIHMVDDAFVSLEQVHSMNADQLVGSYFLCRHLYRACCNAEVPCRTNEELRDDFYDFTKKHGGGKLPVWWSNDAFKFYEERHACLSAYRKHLQCKLDRCIKWRRTDA